MLDRMPVLRDVLVRIRASDIDVLNHVNNIHYADYSEHARAPWGTVLVSSRSRSST